MKKFWGKWLLKSTTKSLNQMFRMKSLSRSIARVLHQYVALKVKTKVRGKGSSSKTSLRRWTNKQIHSKKTDRSSPNSCHTTTSSKFNQILSADTMVKAASTISLSRRALSVLTESTKMNLSRMRFSLKTIDWQHKLKMPIFFRKN